MQINNKQIIKKMLSLLILLIGLSGIKAFSAPQIKCYDNFNRIIPRITSDTETNSYYYKGLGGMFTGVYKLESGSSYLSDNDYAETVYGVGRSKSNYALKIHSDVYASKNQYIQLYYGTATQMEPGLNFIQEFDFRIESLSAHVVISPKVDNAWKNTEILIKNGEIKVGGGVQPIKAKNWYRVAFVFHANSYSFSAYLDGQPICTNIALSNTSQSPSMINSYYVKVAKGSVAYDLYLDNFKWYQQAEAFQPQPERYTLSSDTYSIEDYNIKGVSPNTSLQEFISNLNISPSVNWGVFHSDEKTAVTQGCVKDGMILSLLTDEGAKIFRIIIPDDITVKFYKDSVSDENRIFDFQGNKLLAEVYYGCDTPGNIVFALYSDGVLKDITMSQRYEKGNADVMTIHINEDDVSGSHTLKAMAWEDLMHLRPLAEITQIEQPEHPFLLVKKDEYDDLRARMNYSPWKELGTSAITTAKISKLTTTGSYVTRCYYQRQLVGACSLAFILDPDNKSFYLNKLISLISQWCEDNEYNLYDELYTKPDSWTNAIPPAGAYVTNVLAFDIIYESIPSKAVRDKLENALAKVAKHYYDVPEGHVVGIITVPGTWALFQRDNAMAHQCFEEYLKHFDKYMTEDGVGVCATSYAFSRFASINSNSKLIMPLIMDYTGEYTEFFDNPKYAKFAEWLLGYINTPADELWLIGDTEPTAVNGSKMFLQYWGSKYSATAGGYGAWIYSRNRGVGEILNYLTTSAVFPEPIKPESKIFKDGGAYFYENIENKNSLAAVLWNPTISDGHGHKEVNSVSAYAYGEMITANAGYFGWNKGHDDYTWNYINNSALSANTVLVNYDYGDFKNPSDINDHQSKSGNGIIQGFTSDFLDYARGDSGNAIGNANHERSLIMIKPQDDVPGYFAILDDVSASNENDVVTAVHRPISNEYTTISENTEFNWFIKRKTYKGVNLSVFLATEPTEVEFIDGIIGTQALTTSIPIKSLLSKYSVGENLHKRIGTLMLPSDMTHLKPQAQRFSSEGLHGATISFENGEKDYLVINENEKSNKYLISELGQSLFFDAENVLLRVSNSRLAWYFAENASQLSIEGMGYSSGNDITIFAKGNYAKISAAQETVVSFYCDKPESVSLNGTTVVPEVKSDNSWYITVPSGESEVIMY